MPAPPRLESPSRGARARRGAAVGLAVALVLLGLRTTALVAGLELATVDLRTRAFRGGHAPDERIVLAEIRDEDAEAIEAAWGVAWPWPLDVNAQAFRLMAEAGVEAVVLDVYHLDRGGGPDDVPDPDALGPADRDRLAIEAAEADVYRDALAAVGRVATAVQMTQAPVEPVPGRLAAAQARLGAGPASVGPTWPGLRLPVRRVIEGSAALGFANVLPDVDGIVRRVHLAGTWRSEPVAGLALAAGRLVDPTLVLEADAAVGAGGRQPHRDGAFLLTFPRGADGAQPYARVEPARILDWARRVFMEGEAVPPEARDALEGRVVVWGVNLAGLEDLVPAPIGANTRGPLVQAVALDDLLHARGRIPASGLANALLLLLLTVGAAALAAGAQRRWVHHLLFPGFAVGLLGLGWWLFGQGIVIDLLVPLAALVLAWGGTTTLHLLTEGRRSRWLEGTFGRYLAPSVIEALKRDPGLLSLGGRRREITILFSDVAGFTSISERLEPEEVVALLNAYLSRHAGSVMAHRGVVDKFEGDAVMAFWGDPVPSDDHALAACRTALDVIAGLADLEGLWRSLGLEGFAVRIGLNTGSAIVGNMGSEQRFDYTCMGDAVNLASRLEGANKAFGSTILLGEATVAAAGEAIVVRPLGGLRVVGRDEPVAVAELLALRDDAPPDLLAHAEAFAAALAACRADDLDGAHSALDSARAGHEKDGPVRWLEGLLERLASGTEARPWSGVTSLDRK